MLLVVPFIFGLVALCHGAPSSGGENGSEFYCYHCDDASDNSECKAVSQCTEGQSRCLTQMVFTDDGLAMQKRCAKVQVCYNYEENNQDGCYNPDDQFEGFCSYCCDSPGCNSGLPPYGKQRSISSEDGHAGGKSGKGGLFGISSILNSLHGHSGSKPGPNIKPHGNSGSKPGPGIKPHGNSGSKPGPNIKPHGNSGSKPGPNIKPNGNSGSKPGPNIKPHGNSGSKPGPNIKPHGNSGSKPGPNIKPHGNSGSKPGPNIKPHGNSGSKPGPNIKPHGNSGSKPGPNIKPHGNSGSKPGPAIKPHGNSGSKPGPNIKPHGNSGSKPGPNIKPHGNSGSKPGPVLHTGPHSNPTTHTPTNLPTTQANTNPPQTYAPGNPQPGGNQNVQNPNPALATSCHCHAGQPCYLSHGGNNVMNHGVVSGSSGLDISIHLNLAGLLAGITNLGAGTCPCANQKQIVNVNTITPTTAAPAKATTQKATNSPATTPLAVTSKAPVQSTTGKIAPKFPPSPSTTSATTATTTTTTTTPSTTTTTTPSTTTTTPVPTTTAKPTMCYTCKDLSCYDMNLKACPSDQYYCMNTISQDNNGQRNFTKGCVLENVCHDQWWLGTAGRPDCFLLDSSPSGPPGMPLSKCSFCCHGDGCNKEALPSASSLYNPQNVKSTAPASVSTAVKKITTVASTTAAPSTTSSTSTTTTTVPSTTKTVALHKVTPPQPTSDTTIVTSTAKSAMSTTKTSSPPTTAKTSVKAPAALHKVTPPLPTTAMPLPTTSTAPTTAKTSVKAPVALHKVTPPLPTTLTTLASTTTHKPKPLLTHGLSCSVCGKWGSRVPCTPIETVIAQKQICPDNHFCMTDVLYDSAGHQKLFKRCVSKDTCVKKWYKETSDLSICTQPTIANPHPDLECHYCCSTNDCNRGVMPDPNSLYVP